MHPGRSKGNDISADGQLFHPGQHTFPGQQVDGLRDLEVVVVKVGSQGLELWGGGHILVEEVAVQVAFRRLPSLSTAMKSVPPSLVPSTLMAFTWKTFSKMSRQTKSNFGLLKCAI